MTRTLSKSRLMAFRQCPKRLWLQIHQPELATVDTGREARFAAGNKVGEIARQLQPGGHLIPHVDDFATARRNTRELLATDGDVVLFEPAFSADGALARVDVLQRRDGKTRLMEVKSATSVKEQYYEDVAVQVWVVERTGLPLESVAVAHIDNTFVYGGDGNYAGLFREVDVAAQVRPLQEQVPRWIASAQRMLQGELPPTTIGTHCTLPYTCEFMAWCGRNEPEYPVTILPRATKLHAQLHAEGLRDLKDVPEGRLTNPKHVTIWRATTAGKAEIDRNVAAALRDLPYPRSYMDFETIAPAVPLWKGTRPYQRIPFQWSCHVQDAAGGLVARHALITSGDDPRRRFAETLIACVAPEGPVFTYNAGFERGVLIELAQFLPQFERALHDIADRLVDLLPIARSHYYHPAMMGSWSLKAVLPTIAPDLDYANLDEAVQTGGDIEATFMEIISAGTTEERKNALESALLTYCNRDTLALVRLAAFFQDIR
ncbi:MAG: DUF2779 domain-containing protein [Casimicrobiaceae bacterium]